MPNEFPQNRNRSLYVIAAMAVIAVGLASRNVAGLFPAELGKYPGDALWTLMMFFILGSLLPRCRSLHIAAYALTISCAVELSQLYHSPWIDSLRSNSLVHLVLGSDFDWRDFPAYLLGASAGLVLEQAMKILRCACPINSIAASLPPVIAVEFEQLFILHSR